MASVVKYLEFTITLTNKDQAANLATTYAGGIRMSPAAAAAAYLAPIQTTTAQFAAPNVRSPWIIAGSNFPTNEASFVRKVGGWFGLSFLFGTTYTYRWIGKFAYAPSSTPEINGTPTEVVAIAQRRWAVGFDLPRHSVTNGGPEIATLSDGMLRLSRDASRHVGGRGLAIRNNDDSVQADPTFHGAAASKSGWERFYVRVRKYPTSNGRLWRARFHATNQHAVMLYLQSDGRLAVYNVDSPGAETLQGSSSDALALDTWTRIDVVYQAGNGSGTIDVYFNRKRVINLTITSANGLGFNSNLVTSYIGPPGTASFFNSYEADVDDWIGAEKPTEDSGHRYTGLDWLNGSRVLTVGVTAFGAGNAWTGDYRALNDESPEQANAGATVTSSTGGTALVLNADDNRIKACPGALGAVAFTVISSLQQTVAGSGTLGWRFNGLLDLAAIVQQITANWEQRMYRPAGLTVPIANLTPLELHHIKAANANPAVCAAMFVSIEMIGTFGSEDIPRDAAETDVPPALAPRRGTHNAPYPETIWARSRFAPVSPVIVHSGTYVGNGTFTELTFRSNVNFIYIRRIGGTGQGTWFSSMNTGIQQGNDGAAPNVVNEARVDPSLVPTGVEDAQEQRVLIRLAGSDAAFNGNTFTYQYVAVMDPGSRFMLNGAFTHDPADAGAAALPNALASATFLPEYTMIHGVRFGQGGSVERRYSKGIGHTGTNASKWDAAEAAAFSVAAGLITSQPALHIDSKLQTAYSAWRRDDGSGDPNRFKVVKMGTYIGDGSATRTIGFESAVGLRPLLAFVHPHNSFTYGRDPGHTTNTSRRYDTDSDAVTTGITGGGLDSFIVGILLNANLIVYDYWVLLGSATAGNGGWSIDGEFAYLEPDNAIDGYDDGDDSIDVIDDDEDEDGDPDEGTDSTDDCNTANPTCIAATTRIANVALTHIGVSKMLTNYCTQNSTEAQVVRALYEDSVRKVLRDFPWPFATKYATLGLVAAQPANADWTYAYRMPTDCVFERRLVVDRDRAVDPTPPPFMLSSDSTGGLILTNEPDAVLCYTCRPVCVAFAGDTLFREALGWHLAGALAPPLTRMTDVAKMCYVKYDEALEKAHQVIKPGVPGTRDAADPTSPDAGAACIAANTLVANLGLLRIGAKTIANLATEQSREAVAVALVFESELRATLRDYPWRFAKRYNDALTLIAGTATVPVNVDWQYSYRLPTDFVMARRLISEGTGRKFDADPHPFEAGTDGTGALLFSDETDPLLEYTARIPCAVDQADELFKDAFAWRLAAALAPTLAQIDPEAPEQQGRGPEDPPSKDMRIRSRPNKAAMRIQIAQMARTMYQRTLERARIADANEGQGEDPPDAEWIRGRS